MEFLLCCTPTFSDNYRFATHRYYMYLMYDTIQSRKSSLGYRLLVKRSDWASTMADMESLTADRLRAAALQLPCQRPLLQKLTAIGNPVPQSIAEKKKMRPHVTGITVLSGIICYWLTIRLISQSVRAFQRPRLKCYNSTDRICKDSTITKIKQGYIITLEMNAIHTIS